MQDSLKKEIALGDQILILEGDYKGKRLYVSQVEESSQNVWAVGKGGVAVGDLGPFHSSKVKLK